MNIDDKEKKIKIVIEEITGIEINYQEPDDIVDYDNSNNSVFIIRDKKNKSSSISPK